MKTLLTYLPLITALLGLITGLILNRLAFGFGLKAVAKTLRDKLQEKLHFIPKILPDKSATNPEYYYTTDLVRHLDNYIKFKK